MAGCDGCGTTILFGGVREGTLQFCRKSCRQTHEHVVQIHEVAAEIPEHLLQKHVLQVFEGECPKCGGHGPVDIQTSHAIWSALYMTSWKSKPQLCCHGCGNKARLVSIGSSALLGWWGFPWGLIMTPVQIGRNVCGMFRFASIEPSAQLRDHVRLLLASHVVEQRHLPQSAAEAASLRINRTSEDEK